MSSVLHHSPCRFSRDRGDCFARKTAFNIDKRPLDDAGTLFPLSGHKGIVGILRSQLTVSGPFTSWIRKVVSEVV